MCRADDEIGPCDGSPQPGGLVQLDQAKVGAALRVASSANDIPSCFGKEPGDERPDRSLCSDD